MLTIAEELREEVRGHAAGEYPRECCGILIGRVEGERVEVVRVVRAANVAEAGRLRDRYVAEPLAIVRAERGAREEGLEVVGFYHSHPDHAAAASERDREGAWEGYVYVIVAVTGAGCGEMRGWRLGGDGAMREVEMGVA